jgi:hypothetical protein
MRFGRGMFGGISVDLKELNENERFYQTKNTPKIVEL